MGAAVAALVLLAVDNRTALEVIVVVLVALAASIHTVNYAWYTAAMAGAILIAADVPHPSNLTDEGRRILFTFAGVGIAVIVMFLADRLQKHAANARLGTSATAVRRGTDDRLVIDLSDSTSVERARADIAAGLAEIGTFGLWIQGSALGSLDAMCPAQEASGGGQAPSLSRRQVVPQGRQGTSERQGSVAGDGVGQGAGQPILVGTKLHPPSVRELMIPRERLMERLRSGSDRRLTLVACPAGFGKTTLLAAWREAEAGRKPVAWLTLDEGDNDPVVLWSHAIEAFRRAGPAVARPRRRLRSWHRSLTWSCRAWSTNWTARAR